MLRGFCNCSRSFPNAPAARRNCQALISVSFTAGELDCAFKLFDELKADGKLDLDEIVYNSLLDGCGRKQKPQKAMEYLQDMISHSDIIRAVHTAGAELLFGLKQRGDGDLFKSF